MKVGITIDGILRNGLSKLEEIYRKYSDDDREEFKLYNYDLANAGFMFENIDELISFIYEEHALEIWGHANEMEHGVINHFNSLQYEFKIPGVELVLINREFGKAIPSSFFFLAKTGCMASNVVFVESFKDMWNHVDFLITDNVMLLNDETRDKLLIVKSPYTETFDYNSFNNITPEILKNLIQHEQTTR